MTAPVRPAAARTPDRPTLGAIAQHGAARGAPWGPYGGPDPDPHESLAAGLAQLGEVLGQAGQICQKLAQIELAAAPVSSVMSPVSETEKRPLLSASKVAARMGCTTSTIRRWRRAGKLPPAIEVGGVIRWRPETIEAWIDAREDPR